MTLSRFYKIHNSRINYLVNSALKEDKIYSDITTNSLLPAKSNQKIKAILLCKDNCILAGLEIFKKVFKSIDSKILFTSGLNDGDKLSKGSKVLEITGKKDVLLRGERTALNFLQRMSGVATLTNKFVQKLKFKGSKILHTRKTTPNFRIFELAAVKIGGGDFHRFDLSSSVMAKDNHIESLGSVRNIIGTLKNKNIKEKTSYIEIEAKTFSELNYIVKYGKGIVQRVMLDNFNSVLLDKAIRILKINGFEVELSGGLNLNNFVKIQRKGIDYYSVGCLTHSYSSIDFSLEF